MKKILSATGLTLVICLVLSGCGGSSNTQSSPAKTSPTLVRISVTGPTATVAAGDTLQLQATGTYSDSTNPTITSQVTWQTSDATIATISNSGLVTALKAGTITITATLESVSGNMSVVVSQAPLSSIAVSGDPSLTAGTSEQLTAVGTYADSSTQTITSQSTWQSSDNTIATVSNTGLLTAVSAGPVTITASMGTISGMESLVVIAAVGPPTLTSITISPSLFSIASGQTKQLKALGVFSDGTSQDLTNQATWASVAGGTASVGATGLVTGVSQGSTSITATLGSTSGSATATVTAALLNSIVVSPSTASIATGQTQAFAANGIFSDGSSTDMTDSVSWSSGSTNFASINATGLATGVSAGSATITASAGAVSGSATLTVTPAVLVSVDISPDGETIPIGGQLQLALTGTYSDSTTQTLTNVTWTSSDSTLASVDPVTGIVTGVANSNGNPVTIVGSANGQTDTTTVYVTSAIPESLTLTPAAASIASGTTLQYAVNATFSDGSIQPLTAGLTWSSTSTAAAGISASGLATGIAPGQTTITVTSGSLTGSAVLTVTPATLTAVVVVPTSPTVGINGNVQFTATGIFSDGSTQDVTSLATWSSSAANVALINNAGLTTGLTEGTSTITADYEGVSGTSTLTVSVATLVSITITPANPIVPPHSHLQMTAIGNFSDGTEVPLSGVSWHTTSARYAMISGSGLLRSKKATNQAVSVYARLNGITGQTSLTITSMKVATLQLTPQNATIAAGTTMPFKLIGTFSDGHTTVDLSNSARWQTSNYHNAVIFNSGVVEGISSGSVTITATWGGLAPATTSLAASNATIQSVTVTPNDPTIILGAPIQFAATGLFSDGSTQDITTISSWTSSAPAIAIVGKTGQAWSASHGQANINASFKGTSGSTILTVN